MTTVKKLPQRKAKITPEKSTEITIIEALDRILEGICQIGFKEKLTSEYKEEFDFLCNKLDFTIGQVVLLCVMAEEGEPVSWRSIARNLSISRLRAMAFTPDIEALIKRGWVLPYYIIDDDGGHIDGFRLEYGVIAACRKNECFKGECIEGLTDIELIRQVRKIFRSYFPDSNIPVKEKTRRLLALIPANPELNISKRLNSLESDHSRLYMMNLICDYEYYSHDPNMAYVSINQLLSIHSTPDVAESERRLLIGGRHELQRKGYIEFKCNNGLADTNTLTLTTHACEEFMAGCDFSDVPIVKKVNRELRSYTTIKSRLLYYNEAEKNQLNRLHSVLLEPGYNQICTRLEEKGLRKGIACLFYGEPGTGKTETVLQLARQSGRDIMEVNISKIRDKYVGESEKNIKELFDRYRALCRSSEVHPILFFNEADSIINNRFEQAKSSVEKMDNSIQNIILQELENLEGILIATTNLTSNLDHAFDRRFLFKIEFKKPDVVSRSKIWHSMLPDLSLDDCEMLAGEFEFSGGQIENVVRKCDIDYILSGSKLDIDLIKHHCMEENIIRKRTNRVGF